MINQLEQEFKYSKKNKDFIVLDSFLNVEDNYLLATLTDDIDWWAYSRPHWPEITKLINNFTIDSNGIAIELLITILSNPRKQSIQGLAIELGSRLGFNNKIEAAKIGSALLCECHEGLYDIILEEDGTYIEPTIKADSATQLELDKLCFLPPLAVPSIWSSNTGGWQWDKKSVILGSGNHHEEPQALDVLNKLQQIGWTIDLDVLVNETDPNTEMDKNQFKELVGDYIGEKFHFTYQFDKRGRIYSSGFQYDSLVKQ